MTEQKARDEARRRWGARACVGCTASGVYLVGIALEGAIAPVYFAIRGAGRTWEEALACAAASIAARGKRVPASVIARASHGIPLYLVSPSEAPADACECRSAT